jgi:hypothetical protein
MILELSRDEVQAIIMLNRAGISFLENIETDGIHNLMEKLENSLGS